MQKFTMIDASQAKAKLQNYIARTEKQLSVVKQVIEALQGMEGKEITKRIATALQKKFPELSFSLEKPYSWYDLEIWEKGKFQKDSGSFDTIRLNLGYMSQLNTVTHAEIVKQNQRYLLDEQRLVSYRAELDVIEEKCTAYNNALLAFKAADDALDLTRFIITENSSLYAYNIHGNSI
jgi:hypothetical protein